MLSKPRLLINGGKTFDGDWEYDDRIQIYQRYPTGAEKLSNIPVQMEVTLNQDTYVCLVI